MQLRKSIMRIIVYECTCGADLWLVTKNRPVCRSCGKQMTATTKRVEGMISRDQLQSHNLTHGTMRKKHG